MPAATGVMRALSPLVAGAALKLAAASKTAEIDSRASDTATWSAQARVELFCCLFIELFRLNQFSGAGSVAELRLLRLVDRLDVFCVCVALRHLLNQL